MQFSDRQNVLPIDNIANIEKIIQGRLELPSPPNVAFRLLEVVRDDESSFRQIGDIICKDPSLTARMMKVANSSMFGLHGRIKSIESALAILGIDVIRNIALSFVIMDSVKAPADGPFDMDYFWKRAITSAVAAEVLAARIGFRNEETFLCGLLKDIGVLVIYQQMEKEYKQLLLFKAYANSQIFPIEKELLGFDHGELGGLVLKRWGLPESIYLPIFHHHAEKQLASRNGKLIEILQVSDMLSALYHGVAGLRDFEEVHNLLGSRYGLSRKMSREMIDSLAEKTIEILSFFDIGTDEMKPLSSLLQEANYELGRRALSYEQMVEELRQSREESRQYVDKLLKTNKQLRKLAYHDELTGLYNHRYFQRQVDKELKRAKRYDRPLSLIFFDVDFFKKINDSYGHLVGDEVLRQVASRVSSCMRNCDVVVRYGGDEFAVIMPETDRGGLEILAERLCHEVAKLRIPHNGISISLSISVGGACFDGKGNSVTRQALLSVADQAIYQSKKSGRNTVTIQSVA
jgi:diguanylate cyclase (GGDEF)-like protein